MEPLSDFLIGGRAVVGTLKGRPDKTLMCWIKPHDTEWLAGLPLLLGDADDICTLETFESAAMVFKFTSFEVLRDQFLSYDDGPQVQEWASRIYGLFSAPILGVH